MNLLLEGTDLEMLLLRAAQAGGAGARIVRAEKVRKGGVLGFFAREVFEVTVEVPDSQPVSASAPVVMPESVPASLLDLAERASATQQASARMMALQARYLGLQPMPEDAAVQESWPIDVPALAVNRLNERHDQADLAEVSEPFDPREPADHGNVERAQDDHDLGYGVDPGLDDGLGDESLTDVYRLDSAEPIGELSDELGDFGDVSDEAFSSDVTFHMDPVFADVPTPRLAPIAIPAAQIQTGFEEIQEFSAPGLLTPSLAPDFTEPSTESSTEHPGAAGGEQAAELQPLPERPQFTSMIDQLGDGFQLGKHRLDGPRHTPGHPAVAETTGLPGNSAIFAAPGDEGSSPIEGAAWSSVIHPEGQSATATLEADRTMTTLTQSHTGPHDDSADDAAAMEGSEAMEHTEELVPAMALASARATTIVPSGKSRSRRGKARTVPTQRPSGDDIPATDPEELAHTVNDDHLVEAEQQVDYLDASEQQVDYLEAPEQQVDYLEAPEQQVDYPEAPGEAPEDQALDQPLDSAIDSALDSALDSATEQAPDGATDQPVGHVEPETYSQITQDLHWPAEDALEYTQQDEDPEASDELLGQPEPGEDEPQARSGSAAWRMLRALRPRRRRRNRAREQEEQWTPDTHQDGQEALADEHWMHSQKAEFLAEIEDAPEFSAAAEWTEHIVPLQPPGDFGDPAGFRFAQAGVLQADADDAAVAADQLAQDRETLRSLGLPAAWTRHLQAGDRFTSIVAILERLPQLDIPEDVSVIAVIGPADVVELEAHRTALDLPSAGRPRAVAAVPESGSERRSAIAASKRTRPVVVAIAVESYDDPAETRKVLAQVKAESVIAVIDASRPLEETTRWIEGLENVDAIALDGALDNARPAEVLNLDVPVIRVDGIAVDRIGWAALLCAQLTAIDAQRDSTIQ